MRKEFKIYLAGPMTGLTYDEIKGWRDEFIRILPENLIGYSPLRGKNRPDEEVRWDAHGREEKILSSSRSILTRDTWDVETCDLVFANLLGATRVSIGTVAELAIAYHMKKPIVLMMEEGGVHDHAFINAMTPFVVRSLEEGVFVVRSILLP